MAASRSRAAGGALLALASALAMASSAGCPSLAEIPLDVCGNGVVEPERGEDCDVPPEGESQGLLSEQRCAESGEEHACHYVWGANCCPARTGAGVDGRCRFPSRMFEPRATAQLSLSPRLVRVGDVDGDEWEDLLFEYDNNDVDVVFFEPGGGVRATLPLQRVQGTQTALGHLGTPRTSALDPCGGLGRRPPDDGATANGPGSILLPSGAGVRVLVGATGPSIASKAFAAYSLPYRFDVASLPSRTCRVPEIQDILPVDIACPGIMADVDLGQLELGEGPALLILAVEPNTTDVEVAAPDDANDVPGVILHLFAGRTLDDLGRVDGAGQRLGARPVSLRLPGWEGLSPTVGGCDGAAFWFADVVEIMGFGCPQADVDFAPSQRLQEIPIDEDERPFFLDVTGDDLIDVVIASTRRARILIGDGSGGFAADQDLAPSVRVPQFPDAPASHHALPLATGFIDDDDVLDFVHATSVWTSGDRRRLDALEDEVTCEYRLAAGQDPVYQSLWTEAIIADVNGDQRGDVVAARASDLGYTALDLLLSGTSDVLNPVTVPTERAPRHLDVADLDGDGLFDAVFVIPGVERCADPDLLQVVYGGAVLDGAAVIAELRGVRQVASGPLLFERNTLDGVGDIGISLECPTPDGNDFSAAVLLGTTERRLVSPYPLFTGDEANTIFGTGDVRDELDLSPGDAEAPPPHPELVAVSALCEDRQLIVYVVPATGEAELAALGSITGVTLLPSARFEGLESMPEQDGPPVDAEPARHRTALAVGDLDCDHRNPDPVRCGDDIAVFLSADHPYQPPAPTEEQECPEGGIIGEVLDSPRLHVIVSDRQGSGAVKTIPSATTPCMVGSDGIASPETRAFIHDVDGDGWNDVVGTWTDPDGDTAGGAVVFWNSEAGFLDQCPAPIPIQDPRLVAVAPFRGGFTEPSLAIITGSGAHLLRPTARRLLDGCAGAGDQTNAAPDGHCRPLLHDGNNNFARSFTETDRVLDAAVADYDQDGLDDLILVRAGGVSLHAQADRERVNDVWVGVEDDVEGLPVRLEPFDLSAPYSFE